jgi:hypothetical protein
MILALLGGLLTFISFVAGAAWMMWLHAPLRATANTAGDWRRVDKLRDIG